MRRKSENPVPAILYKAFVFGFGGLSLIYLVAPIVIAITMSFTSGQTLKYPRKGSRCAGMRRCSILSAPGRSILPPATR